MLGLLVAPQQLQSSITGHGLAGPQQQGNQQRPGMARTDANCRATSPNLQGSENPELHGARVLTWVFIRSGRTEVATQGP